MSSNVCTRYESPAYGITGDNAMLMDNGKARSDNSKRRCIIVRSGHGSDGTGVGPSNAGFFFEVTRACTDAGYTVYCIDAAGPTSWWNPASTTAVAAAIARLKTLFGISKVAFFGGSMGGGVLLQAIKSQHASVAGMASISGATDLDYFHGTVGYVPAYSYNTVQTPTFGNWRAECEASYGATPSTWVAQSAGSRIRDEYSSWRGLGIPIRWWHGDADNVVPWAQANAFVQGVADPLVTLRTLPGAFHTPPTPQYLGPEAAEYLEFFDSLTWT